MSGIIENQSLTEAGFPEDIVDILHHNTEIRAVRELWHVSSEELCEDSGLDKQQVAVLLSRMKELAYSEHYNTYLLLQIEFCEKILKGDRSVPGYLPSSEQKKYYFDPNIPKKLYTAA